MLVFCASLLFAVVTARSLYSDGAYYFLRVLTAGNFAEIIPYRSYAGYLFEFPAVIAIKLGVTDMAKLQIAFGIGCFMVWPLVMAICHWLAPKHFWLVVLACGAGYLNAAFVAIGEHIVAHAFFWPVCFVILFARPLTPIPAGILLVSTLILLRSYESLLFLGPPLALLALWRLFTHGEKIWQRAVLLLTAGLLFLAAYIAWDGLRHPGHGPRLDSFKMGMLNELAFPDWTVTWSYLWGLLMIASWSPQVRRLMTHWAGMVILTGIILFWGTWPLLAPGHLDPSRQYEARFLNLLVPMGFLGVAVILAKRPEWLEPQRQYLVNLSAALLIAQSLWHIAATEQWRGCLRFWKDTLASHTGAIYLPDTRHGKITAAERQATKFIWEMDAPNLSIEIGPRKVKSLILPAAAIDCEPFHSFNPQEFPNLERYGIDYGEYFESVMASQKANNPSPEKP